MSEAIESYAMVAWISNRCTMTGGSSILVGLELCRMTISGLLVLAAKVEIEVVDLGVYFYHMKLWNFFSHQYQILYYNLCASVIPVSGTFMLPNGTHKPAANMAGFRVPFSPFHGGPPSQPYAIPTRGGVHGPVGAVPHVPQPRTRGFGAGRGHATSPIGGHLPHQQGDQQSIGNVGSSFPGLEGANSQPSVGGPLSQPGFVNNVINTSYTYALASKDLFDALFFWLLSLMISAFILQMPVQGPSQTFRDGFSMGGMSQVLADDLTLLKVFLLLLPQQC